MDWGAFQLFQGFGRLRFLTSLSRMLLGQGYIRVLPLSLMLCSLVCLQTHRKPQNLLGYGNKCLKQCISKNFFFFFNGEIGVYFLFFFLSTSCFQVVKAHTCEFNGSPTLRGTFFRALKNLEQFWHTTLSSACSSLWATTSAATNGFFWPGWNIFLSFPYFGDKLLS